MAFVNKSMLESIISLSVINLGPEITLLKVSLTLSLAKTQGSQSLAKTQGSVYVRVN